ncbi:MAG: hypothetical protein M0T71_15835 [Actinomycetota bacterium]|nr:hypothetical protein [Actinomycetota bacterium]
MGLAGEFGSVRHLVGRFFGALSPAGPRPDDEQWALAQLLPGEQALWARMSGPDRRHAVGVARDALGRLSEDGGTPGREVAASALLHDVGKVASGLGTFGRVGATVVTLVVGRDRLVGPGPGPGAGPRAGDRPGSWRQRLAAYLTHDRIGAELLRAAGSHPDTVAWAGEHHLPSGQWTLERRVADALKAADGD